MAEKRKFRLNKRYVIAGVGLVAIVLIAFGLGALVRWLQVEYENNNPDSQKNGQVTVPQRQGTDIQNLQSEGKTEEANQRIQEIINDPNASDDTKYVTYIQQGNGFVNSGNAQAGVDAYLKAYNVKETYEVTLLLGDTYAQLGDKPKAIEFYKKALPLVPNNPIQQDEKAAIEQKIIAQGGQL